MLRKGEWAEVGGVAWVLGVREKGECRNNGRGHFQWRVTEDHSPAVYTFRAQTEEKWAQAAA